MGRNIVFLQYTFLFDPVNTWQHSSEFENQLAEFFAQYGKDMEVIKSIGNTQTQKMVLITNKPSPVMPVNNKVGRPQSSGSMLKDLSHRELRAPARDFINKGR